MDGADAHDGTQRLFRQLVEIDATEVTVTLPHYYCTYLHGHAGHLVEMHLRDVLWSAMIMLGLDTISKRYSVALPTHTAAPSPPKPYTTQNYNPIPPRYGKV